MKMLQKLIDFLKNNKRLNYKNCFKIKSFDSANFCEIFSLFELFEKYDFKRMLVSESLDLVLALVRTKPLPLGPGPRP